MGLLVAWLVVAVALAHPHSTAKAQADNDDPAAFQPKVAVVTTLRVDSNLEADWESVVLFWLEWHVNGLGFTRAYVFADSDDTGRFLSKLQARLQTTDPALAAAVTPMQHTHTDRSELAGTWDVHAFINAQIENCNQAVLRAKADRVRWLFHMDVDELLWLPSARAHSGDGGGRAALFEHIAWLEKEKVGAVNYINHEVIPPVNPHVGNYFVEAKLFKRHPATIKGDFTRSSLFHDKASPLVRLGFGAKQRDYFVSYANGKSAVRVLSYGTTLPSSTNHGWQLPPWMEAQGYKRITGIPHGVGTGEYDASLGDRACILHFVNCGLEFWRDKFAILGNFHDKYQRKFSIPWGSFLGSRDAVREGPGKSAEFYAATFPWDNELVQRGKELGLVFEVDIVGELWHMLRPELGPSRAHKEEL